MQGENRIDGKPYLSALTNVEKTKKILKSNILDMLRYNVIGWENVEDSETKLIHVGGAMTNLIFIVIRQISNEISKVLVRIYGEGTERLFCRKEEVHLFKLLSKKGIGIELLHEFQNGRVEKIIEGVPCTESTIRNPMISLAIARKLRELHGVELEIDQRPQVLLKLYEFYQIAKQECNDERFVSIDFEDIHKKIKIIENITTSIDSPVVFCHGDLQYGNIMQISEKDVVFIDFEYSGYNPRGFDIANHFCEWLYDYTKENEPFRGDFERFPSQEEQELFCFAYLQGMNESDIVDRQEVRKLLEETKIYVLVSHLFWALWGLIQTIQSEIDFDFFQYSQLRLDEFDKKFSALKREFHISSDL